MRTDIQPVKLGLLICLIILVFGISLGIGFGMDEELFKGYISNGIAAFPDLHDGKSQSKIWRYAQRAHFHALGIAAFSLVLILVVALTNLKTNIKQLTSILISLGGTYSFAWFSMFLMSPSLGRSGAHNSLITEFWVYLGVGSLLAGIAVLGAHLLFGFGSDTNEPS